MKLDPNYVLALLFGAASQLASAAITEDFDGGGNTPWSLTNTSGSPPAVAATGGASGNYVQLTSLTSQNNNSIAFDEKLDQTGPAPGGIRLAFDFRMSNDAANTEAGGCCGSAADGLGVGLFPTSIYGATGGVNPTTLGQGSFAWERPAFNGAFTIGLDLFQNIDDLSVNFDGAEVAVAKLGGSIDLNDGKFHRAVVNIKPDGANVLVDVALLLDINGAGAPQVSNVFTDLAVTGLDLANLPSYRLIAGGRTGAAYNEGGLDNFSVTTIPEPSSLAMFCMGMLILAARGRRGQASRR